ncbi:hypothetical protein [Lysobacter xanthus]
MTVRQPQPPHDALSAEERELAVRLARLDASAGPSAALDARILAAARTAAAPRPRARQWPTAFGAAAVLVAAVGLAWQMRPMFDLGRAPIAGEHSGSGRAGVESDVVVQVETVPRAATPTADAAAASDAASPPAAARKAAPAAGGGPVVAKAAPQRHTAASPAEAHPPLLDEALPAAAPVAAAPPPPPPEPRALNIAAPAPQADLQRVTVTGSRVRSERAAADPLPDLASDSRLSRAAWLQRIRERRDRGDLDDARTSLARFVAAHPRVAVPRDLQPLLRDPDPWAP